MSLLTHILKLLKWDTTDVEDLEQEFDIDKSLNENWDKLDDFAERVDDVVIDIQDNIEDIKNKDTQQDKLIQKLQSNMINESTQEATSLHVTDASDLPAVLTIEGNYYQEQQEGTDNLAVLNEGTIAQDDITVKIEDGNINTNGTNSSGSTLILKIGTVTLVKGETYYIKRFGTVNLTGLYINNSGTQQWAQDSESSFVAKATGVFNIYLTIGTSTVNNTTQQFLVSKTSGQSWVQGKVTIPSLEYPSRIKTIGDNINLLPNNATNKSENGVDFTVNSDKSIHAVGTATDNVSISLVGQYYDAQEVFRFKKNKQYKNVSNVDILYRKVDGDYVRIQKNTVFSYTEDVPVRYMYIQVDKGTTVDETYYPKIIEYYEGVDESYSPYNLGSLKIIKSNKNLFKLNNSNLNGIELTNLEDGSYELNGTSLNAWVHMKGKPFIIEKGVYTISTEGLEGVTSAVFGIMTEDNSFKQEISVATTSRSFEIGKNMKVISFFTCNINTVYDNVIAKVQLEKSSVKTEWIKHEEKEYNLPIQKEMLKGDYFDLERGKEVHYFNKFVASSSDGNWKETSDITNRYALFTNKVNSSLKNKKQCCSHSNLYQEWGLLDGSFSVRNNGVYFRNTNIDSAEEFNQFVVAQEEVGTPLTFWYNCETYELDLTEEQKQVLNELNNLELFKGVNIIYTEQDLALLQLNYTVDTKMYIDNKLASNVESEG